MNQDVYTYVTVSGTSRVDNAELIIGNYWGGVLTDERSFLAFDLSALRPGRIIAATLRIYMNTTSQFGQNNLYAVTSPWTPGTVDHYQSVSALIASFAPSPYPSVGWYSVDVTASVQAWQANPSQNYGFSLRGTEPLFSGTARKFDSSTGTHPPELVVIQNRFEGTSFTIR